MNKPTRHTMHCPDCGRESVRCNAVMFWNPDTGKTPTSGRLEIADTLPYGDDNRTDWWCDDCGWEGTNPVNLNWPMDNETRKELLS